VIDELFETLPQDEKRKLIDAFDAEVEYMYHYDGNKFIGVYIIEIPEITITTTANNWSIGNDNRIRTS